MNMDLNEKLPFFKRAFRARLYFLHCKNLYLLEKWHFSNAHTTHDNILTIIRKYTWAKNDIFSNAHNAHDNSLLEVKNFIFRKEYVHCCTNMHLNEKWHFSNAHTAHDYIFTIICTSTWGTNAHTAHDNIFSIVRIFTWTKNDTFLNAHTAHDNILIQLKMHLNEK